MDEDDFTTWEADMADEPRVDDDLCAAVRIGRIHGVQQAVEDLKVYDGWPILLSRALVSSIETTNFPALRFLLSYAAVDGEVAEAAAISENISIVQIILDHGWPINRALRGGMVPSILSLAIHNVQFLEKLLELGADPNAESNLGDTALSFAIREGTMNVVKRLIATGSDVTRGDLLHCASRREPSEDIYDLVPMLVEAGTPIDTYQWDNERAKSLRYGFPQGTALHRACEEGNYPAADALLRHGADPHRLKKKKEHLCPPSPLEITKTRPRPKMRRLLETYS
ncbi:hypothetical protein DOTSEDRAFT_149481 [Dothistroma septosporum NZE10]|uniref:Uncharacterized protein n=1 Tax=Dothistroma septosporum (strain NZE10 / CBS 128990) TaxID=675120 RepID=N1PU83_DOTSN|nr:hypothetical protein DOTSEDRAFT_149481 [Dothistroma septosporum NZE10]